MFVCVFVCVRVCDDVSAHAGKAYACAIAYCSLAHITSVYVC